MTEAPLGLGATRRAKTQRGQDWSGRESSELAVLVDGEGEGGSARPEADALIALSGTVMFLNHLRNRV